MTIRVKIKGQETDFDSEQALKNAIDEEKVSGSDQYFSPADASWVPIDEHPRLSTTDARGIYPIIVHLVIFVKILVFLSFLAILDGKLKIFVHPGSWYVYAIMAGDMIAAGLIYTNRNKMASYLLWLFGIASFPLGLFLIISAGMTKDFVYKPAE